MGLGLVKVEAGIPLCQHEHPGGTGCGDPPVSYTHLDVYKRQVCASGFVRSDAAQPGFG